MPHVILTGLGGAQQTAIAQAFTAAGWTVGGISRTAPGAHRANLETGEGLAAAFDGADLVVFTVPQDHRPGRTLAMAEAIARAARGVPRVILNTAARIEPSDLAVFATFRAIRDRLSALPLVTLEPTIYMDNLMAPWSLPGLLSGTFASPAPADVAVAWMSHRTLAEAVVAAATAPVLGQSIRIGGPEALTGPQIAALLSDRLARPVTYAQIPLDGFAAGLNASFGPPAGDRIAELYAHLAAHPTSMADGADGLKRLGVGAESFADFIARQSWTAAA
jgi:nucleoside-diphosphate-sugar epimerase